ncbi:MAG: hypothetical protein ACLPTJ_14305 [Solirubrobacteraceae bacterium]
MHRSRRPGEQHRDDLDGHDRRNDEHQHHERHDDHLDWRLCDSVDPPVVTQPPSLAAPFTQGLMRAAGDAGIARS